MKKIATIIGHAYYVSSPDAATISTPDGVVLIEVIPGIQASFVAPQESVLCSADSAQITAAASSGGSGGSSSGGATSEMYHHMEDSTKHTSQPEKDHWNSAVQPETLNQLLNTSKEKTEQSSAGTAALSAHLITLAAPRVPVGSLKTLSLRCRDDHPEYLADPVFLALYEQSEDGADFVKVGVSTEAVQQVVGGSQSWSFEGVSLHGRVLRIQPVKSADDPFVAQGSVVLGLKGFNTADGSTCDALAYLPEYTFTYDALVSRFSPAEHAENEDIHINAEEKKALHNIVENPPHDGKDGAPGAKGDPGDPGPAGADGQPGKNGVTFTPSVSDDGTLSWSNDGELDNPPSVNIKGADGAPGKDAELTEEQQQAIQFIVTNQEAIQALIDAQA